MMEFTPVFGKNSDFASAIKKATRLSYTSAFQNEFYDTGKKKNLHFSKNTSAIHPLLKVNDIFQVKDQIMPLNGQMNLKWQN